MYLNTIEGYYGAGTRTTIFTATDIEGMTWYAVLGSVNVNATWEDVEDGCNVELLEDCDFFTASAPVESEEDLLEQIEL